MLETLIPMLAAALVTAIYFIITHRRRTPYLAIDFESLPAIDQSQAALAGLTNSSVHRGNRAQVFQNGAFYDAIDADIRAAKHAIHLETFVWTKGEVERHFVDLFCAKAAEGVAVRLLIDAVGGSRADAQQLKKLRAGKVELSEYCSPRWWNLRRFNHRTHRKLLIIDGRIGYAFGHGIADYWRGNAEDKDHWRDTAVRLEGPVVHSMQAVFMENWIEEARCIPTGSGCFPELKASGDIEAHVVSSGSDDMISAVGLLYTAAIASARREVIIQNPYFCPDQGVVELFAAIVKRGVTVHLMVPGKNTDSRFVRRAGCHLYPAMLHAGVRIYEFEPTLLHQKIVIVDELWSHVGSTNFDERSLSLNEEVGIGLFDRAIAAELKAAFQEDLCRSHEITLESWLARPLRSKCMDWAAYQLHDYL